MLLDSGVSPSTADSGALCFPWLRVVCERCVKQSPSCCHMLLDSGVSPATADSGALSPLLLRSRVQSSFWCTCSAARASGRPPPTRVRFNSVGPESLCLFGTECCLCCLLLRGSGVSPPTASSGALSLHNTYGTQHNIAFCFILFPTVQRPATQRCTRSCPASTCSTRCSDFTVFPVVQRPATRRCTRCSPASTCSLRLDCVPSYAETGDTALHALLPGLDMLSHT